MSISTPRSGSRFWRTGLGIGFLVRGISYFNISGGGTFVILCTKFIAGNMNFTDLPFRGFALSLSVYYAFCSFLLLLL